MVKVHISAAITFAVEGFYPQTSAGWTITSFSEFDQAVPLITLAISMVASSFGMSKFFLQGPIPLLPKDSPIKGLISLPFICMLLINCMFGIRVLCIESAFFSSYRYERFDLSDLPSLQTTIEAIDPIIPAEYRILTYFAPSFLSFIINILRLLYTEAKVTGYIRKYPQILLASSFTPFMFEGCNINNQYSIRIWKLGTIINAFFIGCLPQIVLLIMDFYRGVPNWDFLGSIMEPELIYENNDALFKSKYGNSYFALISGILFLFLIILTFFTEKIFKNYGMHCTCCYVLCLPCPQNCITFSQKYSQISSDDTSNHENGVDVNALKEISFDENDDDDRDCGTDIHIYSYNNIVWTTKNSPAEEKSELTLVGGINQCHKFFHHCVEQNCLVYLSLIFHNRLCS